ncbi:Ig-like domain-containing protein [Kocuria gwangalliensis]|uniref:Ig-like domain-containing protein n=1 Tax=Kocuria gwangalliensis TaxID=501592 RepID=A0ABP8WX27_9MICC
MAPQPTRTSTWRSRALTGLAGFSVLALTACGTGSGSGGDGPAAGGASGAAASDAPATEPAVSVAPAADTTMVNPVDPVTVTADQGRLTDVSVVSDEGVEASGDMSEDETTWTSTKPLDFDAAYTVTYSAENNGRTSEGTSAFSTVDAAHEMDVRMNVRDGGTYGVWQIVEFDFSEPIQNKDEIEQAVSVNGGGDQDGAFRWYSDTKLRYRPAEPWAPDSKVKVAIELLGKDVGNGMIGNENQTVNFTTGPEHRAYVDNNTKTLVAFENGRKTGEWPVTLGNPDWPSTTGKKVIIEQAESYEFKPSSLNLSPGDPHYYEPFNASNVARLTWSGEFIHQALPSAMPVLGYANISHGCVGMPPEGAKYIFDTFRPGDMVEVVNTDYPQADPDDGFGDWNIPFDKYSDENWHGNW